MVRIQVYSLAWQQHNLSAIVSFDGVAKESLPLECHVTGLPYKANPPRNSGANPWKDVAGNNSWSDDCVQLYYSAAKYPRIVSPTFHIPFDIEVGVSTKIYREHYWFPISADLCIYQYNSINGNESKVYKNKIGDKETYEPSTPLLVTMTPSLTEYYIQHNHAADVGKVNVYYFNIDYK